MVTSRWRAVQVWGVVVVGAALYGNTLSNGFVLDDVPAIVMNPAAQPPLDLGAIFGTNYWGSPPDYDHLTIYRPLATLSFALGTVVHGVAPMGHHAVNALLHGLVAALVLLLARRLLAGAPRGARWGPLLAGLLFAVHPLHTEAVAGVVSRCELLSALFVLLAILAALRARDGGPDGPRRRVWWPIATIAFALALLSKENAVTALLLLPLMELARVLAERGATDRPEARLGAGFSWPLYALWGAVLVAYLGLRWAVLPGVLGGVVPPSDNPIVAASGAGRWLTPFAVYLESWRLLVAPVGLSVDYTAHAIPLAESWGDVRGLAGLALFAATLGAGIVWARRRPQWAAGLAFFFGAYSVMSHLAFPSTVIFGERLLYLPSVGVCILGGLAAAALRDRVRLPALRAVVVALVAAVLLAGAGLTVARNAEWSDELTLYATSASRTSNSARLRNNLGRKLIEAGRLGEAVPHLQVAARIDPDNFSAWSNLGWAALLAGKLEAADAALHQALKRKPNLSAALNNLCVLRRLQGRAQEGLDACRAAQAAVPHEPTVAANLVRALTAAGDLEEAARTLDEARRRFPGAPALSEL